MLNIFPRPSSSLRFGPLQFIGVAVMVVLFTLDQISKYYIRTELVPFEWSRLTVIPGFFNLVHAWNYGVSFSMLEGNSDGRLLLLVGVALGLCCLISWWLLHAVVRLQAVAYGLILGGAFGNVFDRLHHGAVFDFLQFHLAEYYWPSFNLADSAIFVGVAILLWDGWFGEAKRSKRNA